MSIPTPSVGDRVPLNSLGRKVALYHELHGPHSGPTVVLVAGMGRPLTTWPVSLVRALTAGGARVVVYDHRDTGLSDRLTELPAPDPSTIAEDLRAGRVVKTPYALVDLAGDLLALMDSLNIESFHLVGASMGGMIGQLLAARHPERIASLALMRTSSGNPALPPPDPDALAALASVPAPNASEEEAIRYETGFSIACTGPRSGLTPQLAREMATAMVTRGWDAGGIRRHLAAVMTSGSRCDLLGLIRCPTLVIHGTQDRIVSPAAAREAADLIPNARLIWLRDAGHELPTNAIDSVSSALLELLECAQRAPP